MTVHVVQVNGRLWSVASSPVLEPFAFINLMGEVYRVEDVEDGPLGDRRTLDAALGLVVQHMDCRHAEEQAHAARLAELDAAHPEWFPQPAKQDRLALEGAA